MFVIGRACMCLGNLNQMIYVTQRVHSRYMSSSVPQPFHIWLYLLRRVVREVLRLGVRLKGVGR